MFDQLIGLLLLGLGLRNPVTGNVAGENTAVVGEIRDENEDKDEDRDDAQEDGRSENTKLRLGGNENSIQILNEKKNMRASRAGELRERKEEFKLSREEFKEELKQKREEARELFAEKREEFEAKLDKISDDRKVQIVGDIDEHMNEINQRRTERMSEHLDKMLEIVDKVVSRAATAAENGKDTSSVDSAVTAAENAINSAQDAVLAQAGKEYVITISSETGIGQDVKNSTSTMQSDLKGIHSQVAAAREAVTAAIKALAQALGEQTPTQ